MQVDQFAFARERGIAPVPLDGAIWSGRHPDREVRVNLHSLATEPIDEELAGRAKVVEFSNDDVSRLESVEVTSAGERFARDGAT